MLSDAQGRQDQEPDGGDGAEQAADPAGALLLHREQAQQHAQGEGHHPGLEYRRGDLQAFHGGEHGNGRGDDAVAVEQGGAEQAQQHEGAGLAGIFRAALHQGHEGHDAALALVVGAHDEGGVFHRHHPHQGPEDQGQDAQDVVRGDGHRMVGAAEHLLHGVEGAGADVAVDHAEGGQGQGGEAVVVVVCMHAPISEWDIPPFGKGGLGGIQ
jgi:hypothetical protein